MSTSVLPQPFTCGLPSAIYDDDVRYLQFAHAISKTERALVLYGPATRRRVAYRRQIRQGPTKQDPEREMVPAHWVAVGFADEPSSYEYFKPSGVAVIREAIELFQGIMP